MCGSQGELRLSKGKGSPTRLDEEALRSLQLVIQQSVRARKDGASESGFTDWESGIRCTFQGTPAPEKEEWAAGGADAKAEAEGGRLFFDIKFSGGEATWMKEHEVDQHGYLADWRKRAEEMRAGFSFDDQGYLCHTSCGRIQHEDLIELQAAVQMVARARLALGDVEVTVKATARKRRRRTCSCDRSTGCGQRSQTGRLVWTQPGFTRCWMVQEDR